MSLPEATPSPELVERMVAFVSRCHALTDYVRPLPDAPFIGNAETADEQWLAYEARAILAALNPKPVDPLREGFVLAIEGARCPLHIDSLTGLPLGTQCEALYDALIPELAKHGLTITRKGEEG